MRTPILFGPLLALIICLSFLSPAAQAAPELKDVLRQIEPAVGIVWVHNQKGEVFAHGSGFFLTADGEFVTNRHVLQGAYEAYVEMANGKKYRVTRVLASHPQLDMVKVMVETRGEPVPFLRIAAALPEKGDRVLVYGNPKSFTFVVTEGIVSAIQQVKKEGGDTWIQFTAPVSQGNSGGPLINMNAEVVGIVTWGRMDGQNLNFALPIYELRNLLDYASSTDYAPPGGDAPFIPAAGAVQREKPAVPVVYTSIFALQGIWDHKPSTDLLMQKISEKVNPRKYSVRSYQAVRPQLFKYLEGYIDPTKDVDLTLVPKEILSDFGRKEGIDYILAIGITADLSSQNNDYVQKADLRMVVKLLDVYKGQYIYYDILEGSGQNNRALFDTYISSFTKAVFKALQTIMPRFEKELIMP